MRRRRSAPQHATSPLLRAHCRKRARLEVAGGAAAAGDDGLHRELELVEGLKDHAVAADGARADEVDEGLEHALLHLNRATRLQRDLREAVWRCERASSSRGG